MPSDDTFEINMFIAVMKALINAPWIDFVINQSRKLNKDKNISQT